MKVLTLALILVGFLAFAGKKIAKNATLNQQVIGLTLLLKESIESQLSSETRDQLKTLLELTSFEVLTDMSLMQPSQMKAKLAKIKNIRNKKISSDAIEKIENAVAKSTN